MPKEISIVEIAIIALYFAWNLIVFFLYGADKRKAKRGTRRVSESTLLLSAVLMGGVGAFLGMNVFRHKTKHLKFRIGVPIAILFNILVIAAVVYIFS